MTVYLVGAGPGDPGLFTVRGAEVLARADAVVHDRLASARLLTLAPPGAERFDVGKAPGRVAATQAEIDALLVDLGRRCEVVVRLKGGDPFVFGRGGEEAEALAAAGVPFEVVPGITSAIAAPAYAGIPVTHRGVSTHVTIVTGHEDPAKGRTDVGWEALAAAGGTLVILMGAARIGEIAARLQSGGLPGSTPVAAVRWGTRPEQSTVRGTLDRLAELGVAAPSAIVVGGVAALDLGWFEDRSLFGRRVVVTRAREQASALTSQLEALGAEVIELPAIAVQPIDFSVPPLAKVDWLVFTSPNGVERFFAALADDGRDARALGGCRLAAIGPGTAESLAGHGLRVDLLPERSVAESLVAAFPPAPSGGGRVLLPRAEVARDVLPVGLGKRGWQVEVLPVYRTVAAEPAREALAAVRAGAFDAVTFTSSSTVTNFCDLVGDLPDPMPTVVSIGPVTSSTARSRGLAVDVEADRHDIPGVVAAITSALAGVAPR